MDALEERDSYDIYAPPQAATGKPTAAARGPVFFPVGLAKLAVLSVCTLGLYVVYWFYKSWRQVPGRENQGAVRAAVAAAFCPLTAYFLFNEVERFSIAETGGPQLGAGALAFCFFLCGVAGHLPVPYGLVGLFTFAPLLPVAQQVNRLNARMRPLADPNARFTPTNIIGAAIGGTIVLAAIVGMTMGSPAAS